MKLDEVQNEPNFRQIREERIKEHMVKMFNGEIECDYILKNFDIDVRLSLVMDKARVKKHESEKKVPDI